MTRPPALRSALSAKPHPSTIANKRYSANPAQTLQADNGRLVGMQEDGPFLPGEIERALQFVNICHHAETTQGVGMIEGRCQDGGGASRSRRTRSSRRCR